MSDDFWDNWPAVLAQFDRLDRWSKFCGPGHWPDADMLPLGIVGQGRRTKLTADEQRTVMTLWSIARSPLIFGGDMTKMDDFTLSLITNDEVIAVDQQSNANRQLFRRNGLAAWVADVPGSTDKYLAVFNTRDKPDARGCRRGRESAGEPCRVGPERSVPDSRFVEKCRHRDIQGRIRSADKLARGRTVSGNRRIIWAFPRGSVGRRE